MVRLGIRGARASASLKHARTNQSSLQRSQHPRRARLGLIEAPTSELHMALETAHPRRARLGLIEASSPVSSSTRLASIRGARASASLKLWATGPCLPQALAHPRRARLGLIEAQHLRRNRRALFALASEARAPRPH